MHASTQTLGQAIRQRRVELGMTQEQLAVLIGEGVRQSEVSRLERDRIMLPRRERMEHIAAALDLKIGELLAMSGWAGAEAIGGTSLTAEPAGEPSGLSSERTWDHQGEDPTSSRRAIVRTRSNGSHGESVYSRLQSSGDRS